MDILLINPPAENEIVGNNPAIIEEERGYNPPLGLLHIAAYLEKHTQHHVEILDTQVEQLGYEQLKHVVAQKRPDVVGITVMTLTLIDVMKTVRLVKEIDEGIWVVLGGPHVHIFPVETIGMPGVDYVVLGEGEVTFGHLVDNLHDREALKEVKGLVFQDNGRVVKTGIRPLIDNLDELPFPARHLTPYWEYSSLLAKRTPVTTMFTSRGCPYRCSFCDRPHLGKRFRWRSAKNVVDEMEECMNMGIHEFLVYDDTFTVHRQRVFDICDEIIRRRLDIGWDIRTRVDKVNEEMLRKLKRAHCERIHYGVEAGTEKILEVLQKDITLEQARRAFRMTKEVGISTLAYFMIGSPTETREDIMETIQFMKELDPDFAHVTILCPFPATAVYFQGLRQGVIGKDYWQGFASNPTPDFQPPYWEENLSREELSELIRYAYKSFYTRPKYIFRQLVKVRSLGEFERKVTAGLRVLHWQ
jgi:anaerobic magnesium-protoporphyrin IX monomethyl ester cyclase